MDPHSDVDILLIEDNPRDAELTIRALQKRHLANRIEWVKDGAAALAFIFGGDGPLPGAVCHRPKVILLDLKLPKVDGLDVLRQLKAHDTARFIPVVVLSSSREEQDILRSYELGVNSYIVKPVSFDNFSEAVAQLGLYWLLMNEQLAPRGDTRRAGDVP
jgi:two-component system response regulator